MKEELKDNTIMVIGIGGVGGILSSMLLKEYGENVYLIARGERKSHLISNGITIKGDLLGDFTVKAPNVEESPAAVPPRLM